MINFFFVLPVLEKKIFSNKEKKKKFHVKKSNKRNYLESFGLTSKFIYILKIFGCD